MDRQRTEKWAAILIATIVVALSAAAGTALAGRAQPSGANTSTDAPRERVRFSLSTTRPGTPTASDFTVVWHGASGPGSKPYAVQRIVSRLQPGSVTDTTALKQCKASDSELMNQGAAACPRRSRIGSGHLRTLTGVPGAEGVNKIFDFNNQDEVIGLAESKNPPIRTISHTRIRGNVFAVNIPLFPGAPPPDPYLAFKRLHLHSRVIVRNGKAYARTPPYCPSSGRWRYAFVFIYHDGVRERVVTHAPCQG